MRGEQVVHARPARCGVGTQAAAQGLAQGARDAAWVVARVVGAGAVEGLPGGDAEGELIGGGVDVVAEALLGGHVAGGAGAREGAALVGDAGSVVEVAGGGAGDAEVDDAGAARVDEDVVRFEVAMDDAGAVGCGEATTGSEQDVGDLAGAARGAGEPEVEGVAVDELHGEEHLVAVGADVEDRDDVGVAEAREGLALAQEAVVGAATGDAAADELDGEGRGAARGSWATWTTPMPPLPMRSPRR
jgi:hypothetical protein